MWRSWVLEFYCFCFWCAEHLPSFHCVCCWSGWCRPVWHLLKFEILYVLQGRELKFSWFWTALAIFCSDIWQCHELFSFCFEEVVVLKWSNPIKILFYVKVMRRTVWNEISGVETLVVVWRDGWRFEDVNWTGTWWASTEPMWWWWRGDGWRWGWSRSLIRSMHNCSAMVMAGEVSDRHSEGHQERRSKEKIAVNGVEEGWHTEDQILNLTALRWLAHGHCYSTRLIISLPRINAQECLLVY